MRVVQWEDANRRTNDDNTQPQGKRGVERENEAHLKSLIHNIVDFAVVLIIILQITTQEIRI